MTLEQGQMLQAMSKRGWRLTCIEYDFLLVSRGDKKPYIKLINLEGKVCPFGSEVAPSTEGRREGRDYSSSPLHQPLAEEQNAA